MPAIEGSCLCGGTKVKVENEEHDTQAGYIICHCNDCKQTSGSAFSTNILAKDVNITVTGLNQDYVSKAASGRDVTRTFCSKCGSSISHKSAAFGDATAVQTGNLIQHFKNVKVGAELFTKDRWVAFTPVAEAAQKETM
ncbi:hypothetical protein FIBSPDRAFT_944877 [Athelia psychrophila]|uniref:CENP-V/GFA domain-containing protein n=1 Tax=Athelia psychrophila TaxID=1759441 RepID=A0A166ULM0_9AGAM|nr:hypothetical protein FIBSPDRAFT_944877 [Fibularhizoctonia sp. CBS 109695]